MDIAKIKAKAAEAAKHTDMTKAKVFEGREPLAAGPCRLRLVSYIELGKHEKTFKGTKSVKDMVSFTFEVSGPKHPPREVDGEKFPNLITITETRSLSNKARFFKLVQQLNWKGTETHAAGLVGEAFKGEIIHRKYAKQGEDKAKPETWTGVAEELYNKATGTFTIQPPRVEDAETGEWKMLTVADPIAPYRLFLWEDADMDQWASIFIDGEYPAQEASDGKPAKPAKSKNVLQAKIKSAKNFKDSPIYTLLLNNGQDLDVPDVDEADVPEEDDEGGNSEPAAKQPVGDDALAGIA